MCHFSKIDFCGLLEMDGWSKPQIFRELSCAHQLNYTFYPHSIFILYILNIWLFLFVSY